MKSAPDALVALINNSQQFRMADLYEITLINGDILRYTDYDVTVIDNGNTYLGNSLLIQRSRIRLVLGVEVDTMDLTIHPHPADVVGSNSFLTACASGLLDGSHLVMRRCFFDDDGLNVGSYINFSGRVADMQMTRTEINMTIKSDLELLNVKLPRNLYQASCLNTLYDNNCALNRASFLVNGTVVSGSKISISCTINNTSGHFDLGYVLITSGVNTGLRRTVKSYIPGSFTLLNPLPYSLQPGDTFGAYPGCNKAKTTCESAKFNNVINFRGFPFVPVPETTR